MCHRCEHVTCMWHVDICGVCVICRYEHVTCAWHVDMCSIVNVSLPIYTSRGQRRTSGALLHYSSLFP